MSASPVASHPDPNTLALFGFGRLSPEQRVAVERHIAQCPDCYRELEQVHPDAVAKMARPESTSRRADEVPAALIDHPRYRVIARLGAGGMGVVYKAEHRVMGRTVALKVINSHHIESSEAIERFRREVRIASRLGHPNIVTAFDADEADGLHFLVMEFVPGTSLDRYVARKGPLPVTHACYFIRQAALGLQHAVDHGMIHRDIKPHNLMVTPKGQVKILDFGLARAAAGFGTESIAGVTAPQLVVGTPDYLAPEQARNAPDLDHRADIYSLGCTLYFLLTGRAPFAGVASFDKLMAHVQNEPAPVTELRSDLPTGLPEVLAKMMAKRPANRFQTPTEVAAALAPFARTGDGPSTTEATDPDVAASPTSGGRKVIHRSTPPDDDVTESIRGKRSTHRRAKRRKVEVDLEPESPSNNKLLLAIGLCLIVVVVSLIGFALRSMLRGSSGPDVVASASTTPPVPQAESPRPKEKDSPEIIAPAMPTEFPRQPRNENEPWPFAPPEDGLIPKRKYRPGGGDKLQPPGGGSDKGPPPPPLPRTVLIVLPPRGVMADYTLLRQSFEKMNYVVKTVAPTRSEVSRDANAPGAAIKPDFVFADLTPPEFDRFCAFVFVSGDVSGYSPGKPEGNEIQRLISRIRERRRLLAAVGSGVRVLGEHGELRGLKASRGPFYNDTAVEWTPEPVVHQPGGVVTAGELQNAGQLASTVDWMLPASPKK